MGKRVYNKKISINKESVKDFFIDRVNKYDSTNPVVSMLLQDSNPGLAEERDLLEKQRILPLLNIHKEDKVLDVGCGIGRWADSLLDKVSFYHGTDIFEELIAIAKERFDSHNHISFTTISAQEISEENPLIKPPYNLVLIAGVFQYINDQEVYDILKKVGKCCSKDARVYIRIPIGIDERLTLNQVWSEELKSNYSAIYRTHKEYIDLFNRALIPLGFEIVIDQSLYPDNLNNRKETKQHFFILTKKGE